MTADDAATWSSDLRLRVREARERVAALHAELPRWGLVVWTAGNVSERVRGDASDGSDDLMVIKPSGVTYDHLTPDSMVVCDLSGHRVLGMGAPSSDTAAHAYVYRQMNEVGGVCHTHSTYATAWAACGAPIPCVLTMMGDEFGGDVPVGPFALIGDDSIGRGIVETLRDSRSPAVLMRNHGPFTIRADAGAAVKAAAMVEEVAKTCGSHSASGGRSPSHRSASTTSTTATTIYTDNIHQRHRRAPEQRAPEQKWRAIDEQFLLGARGVVSDWKPGSVR
jgi:L-ribulose-5-phosphate 4-epimerase